MAYKSLLIAALFSSASVAAAADIGPNIGFAVGRNVSLATADGSTIKQLYSAPSRKIVLALQLKPGGGEAALVETDCCSQAASSLLKLVRYDNNGVSTGTASIAVCGSITGIGYHPTDGTLLYVSSCDRQLKRLNTATMTSTTVSVPHQVFTASWLPNGTELLYAANSKIWRVGAATPNAPTAVGDIECIQTLDAGSLTNQALYACPGAVTLMNLSTGQSTVLRQGEGARFSPDDSRYVYLSPLTASGRYLLISNLNGSGAQTRIGSKAKYLAVDWRK